MVEPNKEAEKVYFDEDYTKNLKKTIGEFEPNQQVQVALMGALDKERKRLDLEMEKEIHNVIMKYDKIFQPIYQKIHQVVEGKYTPTAEEKQLASTFVDGKVWSEQADKPQEKIKNFWYDAMLNNGVVYKFIKKSDEEPLSYLSRVELVRHDGNKNFDLVFHFEKNPYFTNATLTKQFFQARENDPLHSKMKEQVNWVAGKELNKSEKGLDMKNFFDLFFDCNPKEHETAAAKIYNAYVEKLYIEFDIAVALRDEVIPTVVDFYLGLVEDEEDDYEDDKPAKEVLDY